MIQKIRKKLLEFNFFQINTIFFWKLLARERKGKKLFVPKKPFIHIFFQPFEVRSVFSKNRIRWDTDHGVMPIATKKASEIFFLSGWKIWWWICASFFNSKFLELRIGKNINFCFHFSWGGGEWEVFFSYLEDFFLVYVHMKLCTL